MLSLSYFQKTTKNPDKLNQKLIIQFFPKLDQN